jgi:hypothetical protein
MAPSSALERPPNIEMKQAKPAMASVVRASLLVSVLGRPTEARPAKQWPGSASLSVVSA